jgi:carbamoyl-phosphate synthase small subunit
MPEDAEVFHINLNDNTVEGLRIKDKNILCVQYHPEAGPGPHDARFLFDEMIKLGIGNK